MFWGRKRKGRQSWWLSSCCSSVTEHWLHKPGVLGLRCTSRSGGTNISGVQVLYDVTCRMTHRLRVGTWNKLRPFTGRGLRTRSLILAHHGRRGVSKSQFRNISCSISLSQSKLLLKWNVCGASYFEISCPLDILAIHGKMSPLEVNCPPPRGPPCSSLKCSDQILH